MVAMVVVAISLVDPSAAPQTLATVAASGEVSIGAKVVAAASLSAVVTSLNTTALATELKSSGVSAATMAIFTEAAANPATVISPVVVTTAQTTVPTVLLTVSTVPPISSTTPPLVEDVQQSSDTAADGYAGQTSE